MKPGCRKPTGPGSLQRRDDGRFPKRVLIVDDDRNHQGVAAVASGDDPRTEVVGEAGDLYEARAAIKALNPDVLTLDVEMPRMNGLVFLEHLMRLRPMPVVMVSTRTAENSETVVRALLLGAIDCIELTRVRGDPQGGARLSEMLVMAAEATVASRVLSGRTRPTLARFHWNGRLVLVGASTGGVDALERVLVAFPANCPPTVIAQHMAPAFLRSFANRLDTSVAPGFACSRVLS